jgi:hypothetical protein
MKSADAANLRTLDRALTAAIRTLRARFPQLGPEALEVIEQIEADIEQRRREYIAAGMARWVDAYPDPEA